MDETNNEWREEIHANYLPSPEKIADECERIRSGWTSGELRKRTLYWLEQAEVTFPTVSPIDKRNDHEWQPWLRP